MTRQARDVVVIGGGQAGLAAGYHLKQQAIDFVILDAKPRVGDSWRDRWDSLTLFTPAERNGLPGEPFPATPATYATKDQMADYLERYAERFQLPVRLGTAVRSLTAGASGYEVGTDAGVIEAQQVVIAIGAYQAPFIPRFSADLAKDVVQMHSSEYRRQAQLQPGTAIIVGTGNSGVQIAMELARTHKVYLAGRYNRERPQTVFGRDSHTIPELIGATRVHLDAPFFRKLLKKARRRFAPPERRRTLGDPLVGINLAKVTREYRLGRVPRAITAKGNYLVFDDGDCLRADNVIWATGFQWNAPWIHLPVLDEDGVPDHVGGVARGVPGIYFLGLRYLRRVDSSMIHGVGRDAEAIVQKIAATLRRPGHT